MIPVGLNLIMLNYKDSEMETLCSLLCKSTFSFTGGNFPQTSMIQSTYLDERQTATLDSIDR